MADVARPPVVADADALHALAVGGAAGVQTVRGLDVALGALPALAAVTPAAAVHSVAAAKHGTNTCKKKETTSEYSKVILAVY